MCILTVSYLAERERGAWPKTRRNEISFFRVTAIMRKVMSEPKRATLFSRLKKKNTTCKPKTVSRLTVNLTRTANCDAYNITEIVPIKILVHRK